jgi:hypothetical protein
LLPRPGHAEVYSGVRVTQDGKKAIEQIELVDELVSLPPQRGVLRDQILRLRERDTGSHGHL